MASHMHIKIDGIDGESEDKQFKGEIDIQSWAWGMSQATEMSGGGVGVEKASVKAFTFQHLIDKATPNLELACLSGKVIPKAVFTQKKAGEEALVFLKISFEDVIISGLEAQCSGAQFQETVSLRFARFKTEYQAQDTKTGKAAGGAVVAGWDIKANTKT